MTGDDVMIADCGATKHCIPDATKLSKITDAQGEGWRRQARLDVSVIGEIYANQGQHRDNGYSQEDLAAPRRRDDAPQSPTCWSCLR